MFDAFIAAAKSGVCLVDRLSFDKMAFNTLSAVPAAAHQEHVAVEVLRAAWRRRRLVIGIAVLAMVASLTAILQRPVRYPADALIELQVGRSAPSVSGDSAGTVVVEASSIVLGEARIIRSRLVAERVVKRLNLADDPDFVSTGLLGQIKGWLFGFLGKETPDDARARRVVQAEQTLTAGLSVETDNRSYLISITYKASRPELAARIANAVAEEYLARRLETNLDTAGSTAEWLTDQLASAETNLKTAEAAVAAYREKAGLADLGGQNDNLPQQQLREFAVQLNAASLSRIAEEGKLARIESLARVGAAGSAAELQAMPLVQAAAQREATAQRDVLELQTRFGPLHPAMQQAEATLADAKAALAAEIDRGVASLRAKLRSTIAMEKDLRDRVETMQRAVIQDSAKIAELRNLQKTADGARERLTSLTRRRDEARALRDLRVVPASLIVPAQPAREPAGLSPIIVSLAGLFGGIVVGITLAALLERIDHGFRTSADVVGATDMRCLGLVPELSPDDPLLATPDRSASETTQVMFDESVRLVASSVGLFSAGHREDARIVLVTSALPDEGRSTLCAGMARALSLAGRRVLLINGRPRRFDGTGPIATPSPTKPANNPNTHQAPSQALAPKTHEGSLVLLHRHSGSATSLDVFGSSRLSSALEQARKHFDVIIIEGPPIMLVADALVLGRMADTVIHVARWAGTARRTVQTALHRMRDHGIAVDGVVLTRVDVDKHAALGLADSSSYHLQRHSYYAQATKAADAARPAVTHDTEAGILSPEEEPTVPGLRRNANAGAHG